VIQVNDYNDTEQYDAIFKTNRYFTAFLWLLSKEITTWVVRSIPSTSLFRINQILVPVMTKVMEITGSCAKMPIFMVLDVMDENKWGDHEEFIADACEANPDIRWKLVFSHYSPYNSYEEYMEKGQEMRPYFLKFADDYDIDAVLCGHNHCYMRSYFINGDGTWQDYENPAVDPEGTLYLTLGSSSGSLYHKPSVQEVSG